MVVHIKKDMNMLGISNNESAINKRITKEMAGLQVPWKPKNIGYINLL